MLPDLSAFTTGQVLALYEHVTAAMVRRTNHMASTFSHVSHCLLAMRVPVLHCI